MSWFSVNALKGLAEQATNAIPKDFPKVDGELLKKLTLTSPELQAEHDRIDEEERRKETVRDMLAGMLPWETRDPERDILVEECKQEILKLSLQEHTFLGPYQMPKLKVKLTDDDDDKDAKKGSIAGGGGGGGDDGTDDVHHHIHLDAVDDDDASSLKSTKPSEESLERLRNLEPLPPLLSEFDLDSHVGLIERLLKEDPKLVVMQSKLSGGGEREQVFWHNYFFNCAWCRYEAGLSIDEIWSEENCHRKRESEQPAATTLSPSSAAAEAAGSSDPREEETIVFESSQQTKPPSSEEKAFPADPATDPKAPFRTSETSTKTAKPSPAAAAAVVTTQASATAAKAVQASTTSKAEGGSVGVPTHQHQQQQQQAQGVTSDHNNLDFEFVEEGEQPADQDGGGDDDALGDVVDYELDELEAEIARELED